VAKFNSSGRAITVARQLGPGEWKVTMAGLGSDVQPWPTSVITLALPHGHIFGV